jgi:hypothetical protein
LADEKALFDASKVERITFEQGSHLREVQKWCFSGFESLKSICLPASVQSMDGRSFLFSRLSEISIESGNRFFRASGPFLLDFEGIRIVRYFGSENEVTVSSEIEILGTGAFSSRSISAIRFQATAKLSVIELGAFGYCDRLQSITIPSSVTIIGQSCFGDCRSLQVVSFEPDSQLISLGECTFEHCAELKGIVLPSSLEIIGSFCFCDCHKLGSVTFQDYSKLVRIERMAFAHCFSLKSLSLPPLLEFVGEHCFFDSSSFSILAFSSPSRLWELLDLPPLWTGFKEIPDSVEVLQFCRSHRHPDHCTLTFGDESRLRKVRINSQPVQLDRTSTPLAAAQFRYFVRATSRSLKLIRSTQEFDESG